MPKLDEIFGTVAIIFFYRYEKSAVLKMFTRLFFFSASEGLEKRLRETVYKQDKEEMKKKRRIVAFVNWKMPKLAQILTFVGKFVVVHFFSCIKQTCQVKM